MSDPASNSPPGSVPSLRIRALNTAAIRPQGRFVLYWMIASRRTGWNFGLQRAVDWAKELGKPLVVLEPLRSDYAWACARFQQFVVEGMADQARHFARYPVLYYPYLEPEAGAGRGLLEALAAEACVVVTDDFPSFFLPRMVQAAGQKLSVRLEAIDCNGLLPMRATDQEFTVAHSFRRFLQKSLLPHLADRPAADPLTSVQLPPPPAVPEAILKRWPPVSAQALAKPAQTVAGLPVSADIAAVRLLPGGSQAAGKRMQDFLKRKLQRYPLDRNEPEKDGSSGLSPYLHFGQVSTHEIFWSLVQQEDWDPGRVAPKPNGKREGWWGMSPAAEGFLDELITWREIGFNLCTRRPDDYDRYESLPGWALTTLEEHADDPRPHVYTLQQMDAAQTYDKLWNAAQTQLVREGRIHNYLRMLWGKKILEWTPHPRAALEILIELNNKYALDGRNPNSYSGIFWVLGRYDRAWGPVRPIFGKIRFMDSKATARKMHVADYIRRYAP